MKNVIGILLLSVISLSVSAQPIKDYGGRNRYAKENVEFLKNDKTKNRVVLLGNSITEGWVGKHNEFFIENNLIGRGISGHTSSQFLVRFRDDVINLTPKVVVINAGTNDVAENIDPYDEDFTFGNIVSMVELAKANNIKVILTSVLPADKFWRPIENPVQKIKSLNARLKDYAAKNKIIYIDYFSALKDENDALPKKYSDDGVHPSVEGYKIMEELLLPAIIKLRK